MDIRGPTDGPGVSQGVGGGVHCLQNEPLVVVAVGATGVAKLGSGNGRGSPSAEILGREFFAADAAEVIVDLIGGDAADLAFVLIGEKFLMPLPDRYRLWKRT